jgi:hypothetical protein
LFREALSIYEIKNDLKLETAFYLIKAIHVLHHCIDEAVEDCSDQRNLVIAQSLKTKVVVQQFFPLLNLMFLF